VGKKYHGMTVEEHLHHGKTVVEIKRVARDLLDECGASSLAKVTEQRDIRS
jgi:hypothetical protein